MKQPHCMVIIGTRPEAIKMAPIVDRLRKMDADIHTTITLTGQHREIVDQVLDTFDLAGDIDLALMEPCQTLAGFTGRALTYLGGVFERDRPDLVLAQGDTSTVFAASLAAFYLGITVGHVEAGLRTNDIRTPFPEEATRRLTAVLADLHFAPTARARDNLLQENIDSSRVFVTGNTVIDALLMIKDRAIEKAQREFPFLKTGKRIVLVTAHRRENHGHPMEQICGAVSRLVQERRDIQIIWPVHPNPAVSETVHRLLDGGQLIHLVQPMEYCSFVGVMWLSSLVLTDSGGLQEEAPALGKPVLVLRETTERPEGIAAGTAKLVGNSREEIVRVASRLLDDPALYRQMAGAISPYGDGKAAQRIVGAIRFHLGLEAAPPDSFVSGI